MAYTPNDIYDYIIENDRESEFLQAITLHKQNFSIGEITDRRFLVKEDKTVKFISKMYKINIQITDDDIITAVMNGLYVSAFISRQGDAYNVHFLVHAYPENMKSQFDDEILKEVLRYMIMMTIVRLRLDTPEKVEEYLGILHRDLFRQVPTPVIQVSLKLHFLFHPLWLPFVLHTKELPSNQP